MLFCCFRKLRGMAHFKSVFVSDSVSVGLISLTAHHEDEYLTSIRHIRRLTHPKRTANLGSSSSGNSAGSGNTASSGGGSSGISRSSRAAMMQLVELPSLPGADLSSASRDPMDPITGWCSDGVDFEDRLPEVHNVYGIHVVYRYAEQRETSISEPLLNGKLSSLAAKFR